LDGALASAQQRGQRALAPETANDAFGGIELFPIHAISLTKFSLTTQEERTGAPRAP
jgi:hypothetical protein